MHQYLEKATETRTGAEATCWRINDIRLNIATAEAIMEFNLYKDFQAFLNGKMPIEHRVMILTSIDQLQCYAGTFGELLSKCLEQAELSGAVFKEVEEVPAPAE